MPGDRPEPSGSGRGRPSTRTDRRNHQEEPWGHAASTDRADGIDLLVVVSWPGRPGR
ncbi:ribosomal large subunit pseudouridine synthase A [Actinomyces sp. oral taxon 448 str. F0400]|nr:ribosomal large subunit pseudouridine synthase A [Actinomyces sp. oral taxon 448 str. F0400]